MYSIVSQKGFTLLETIIYIALFTFVIGGGLASAYQIFEGSTQIKEMSQRETEINFMLRKLDWLLSDTESSDITIHGGGTELEIDKGSDTYTLKVLGDQLVVETAVGTLPITNDFVGVNSIDFQTDGGTPETITTNLFVDGETIGPIKHYVRQN